MTMANRPASRSCGKKPSLREELLRRRYFLKDASGHPTETREQMYRRVAVAVAGIERKYGADDHAVGNLTEQFASLMTHGMFLPNSPTVPTTSSFLPHSEAPR